MAKKSKVLSSTVKGLGKIAGETVKEGAKQAGKAAEETAGELLGGGGGDKGDNKKDLAFQKLKKMNKDKTDEEIAQLLKSIRGEDEDSEGVKKNKKPKVSPKKAPQVGGRDVDKEIQEVKEKKKKKEEEEERLVEEMKKKREKEKEEAKKEAEMAGPGQGPLDLTGSKGGGKKRGSALVQQRGKGREIKGGKN